MQVVFNLTLSILVFICNGYFGSWCWNNLVAKSSIPELSPINVMGIILFLCFLKPMTINQALEMEEFSKRPSQEKANMATNFNIAKAIIVAILCLEVFVLTFFK